MPQGLWVLTVPAAVAVAVLLFLILRARVPFLKIVESPVEKSALRRAEVAEDELTRANNAIDALVVERDQLLRERSLAAVIELVEKVSQGVDQTLAMLSELNGGLRHTAEALGHTNENMKTSTKAMELLASQIIVDLSEKRS